MKIYITDKAVHKKQEIMALLEKRKWHDPDFSGMDFDVRFIRVPDGGPEIELQDRILDEYSASGLYYSLTGILSGCSNDL